VTVWQTVLVYVVIPAGIYGVIALLTLAPGSARTPRYRPGQPWNYPPVWWTGSPNGHVADSVLDAAHQAHGAHANVQSNAETLVKTARGGASGNW
jgi:hypothetical protein